MGNPETSGEYQQAAAGYVRTTIRIGDIAKAMKMIQVEKNTENINNFAILLEEMKQYHESAFLFEKCQNYERAADVYIRLKNFDKVATMLPIIKSLKIHRQYAKYLEGTVFIVLCDKY